MVDKIDLKNKSKSVFEKIKFLSSQLKKYIFVANEKAKPYKEKARNKVKTLDPALKKRLYSGIVIAILSIFIVVMGGILYIASMFAISCFMIYELVKMLKNIEEKDNKTFVSLRKFGVIYIICFCISMVLIRENQQGLKITIWMFLTIWSLDSFAYFFGKKFGKIKLAPVISPKKTYEGAILGSAGALLVSIIIYRFSHTNSSSSFSLESFVIFSIITIILAQLGDLSESYIKRKCEVKDSGTIIPGHGGFFDRFDSFLIVAPFVYIIIFLNGGVLF